MENSGHHQLMTVITSKSTANNLSFSSFPLSHAITVSSRCVWVSRPSTLSGPATTSCGTQPALSVVPAQNFWWTWSTSGRKASCTADATTETARSRAVAAVMRWEGKYLFKLIYMSSCVIFLRSAALLNPPFDVCVHSLSSVMSTLRLRARTGTWSTSAVLTVIAFLLERHMSWKMTSLSASPATWRTTLWWDTLSFNGFLFV